LEAGSASEAGAIPPVENEPLESNGTFTQDSFFFLCAIGFVSPVGEVDLKPRAIEALQASDGSFISFASSQFEDRTITGSSTLDLDAGSLDNTLTNGAFDTQSICSEQSLVLVEENSSPANPSVAGAPAKPPRGSMRVERKNSRTLPAVPSKGLETPIATSSPALSLDASLAEMPSAVSSPAAASAAVASAEATPIRRGSTTSETVRKVGSP
jgi:hypothetical protein